MNASHYEKKMVDYIRIKRQSSVIPFEHTEEIKKNRLVHQGINKNLEITIPKELYLLSSPDSKTLKIKSRQKKHCCYNHAFIIIS